MITFQELDFINEQEAVSLKLRIIFMLSVFGVWQNSPGKETVDADLLLSLTAGVDH